MYSLLKKSRYKLGHPDFYADLMAKILPEKERTLYWQVVALEREIPLSHAIELSALQPAASFRALHRARHIALYIVDERGEIKADRLEALIADLKTSPYTYYPDGETDALIQDHILRTLLFIQKEGELKKLLKHVRAQTNSEHIKEILIGSTGEGSLTGKTVTAAILSALLTPLRQSIGSCFATAPAIWVQQENPLQLALDLVELCETARLKRTIRGDEILAPIALSYGSHEINQTLTPSAFLSPSLQKALKTAGIDSEILKKNSFPTIKALFEAAVKTQPKVEQQRLLKLMTHAYCSDSVHPLLKIWEYTIATFSDYKVDFYKWNLSATLGFDAQEKGGVGEILFSELSQKLTEENEKARNAADEVDHALSRLRLCESLLRNADSENRARQLKVEFQMRLNELRAHEDMYHKSQYNAESLSKFHIYLTEQYQAKLQTFFQEVYDPDIIMPSGESLFSDTPSGFRLIYKHGRSDPSLWTPIYDEQGFAACLRDFFITVESTLVAECEWKEGRDVIRELNARLIAHVGSASFIESAQKRIARFHGSLGQSLLEGYKTPWSYIAGGSMTTLVRGYLSHEGELESAQKEVASPEDLVAFLLDRMKNLPWKSAKRFVDEPFRSFLISSPTHAFLLKPGIELFKRGWIDDGKSSNWIKERLIHHSEHIAMTLIKSGQSSTLEASFAKEFPGLPLDFPKDQITLKNLRESLCEQLLQQVRGVPRVWFYEKIDHVLRRNLPIYSKREAEEIAQKVCGDSLSALGWPEWVTHRTLIEGMKAVSLLKTSSCAGGERLDEEFRLKVEEFGFGPPSTLFFGDSNWAWNYLAFIYNPATESLELWRVDRSGLNGYPMKGWERYLKDGSTWTLYLHSLDYKNELSDYLSMRV